MSDETQLNQLTLFVVASPVKTCQLPESARAWLENAAGYGSSSTAFYQSLGRDGLLSKTSPVYYPLTEDGTLPSYFKGWQTSGIYRPGECWTLSISEFPSAAAAFSLSQVLETDVPPKYFLSAKACAGILRRAEKRGKKIPASLERSLLAVRDSTGPAVMEIS